MVLSTEEKHTKEYEDFINQKDYEPEQIDRDSRQFTSFEDAQLFAESKGQEINPQLKYLLQQPRFEQRTEEWHAARSRAITASIWGAACSHAEYGSPLEVFKKKTETEGDVITNEHALKCMAHGNKYEDAAAKHFEDVTGKVILDFGLLQHWRLWDIRPEHIPTMQWYNMINGEDRPEEISEENWAIIQDLRWIGGSPDGITADGWVIEIKCPFSPFVDGKIKKMYLWQLYLNMAVAGLTKGYFIQYAPKKDLLFKSRYDCTEVTLPDGWFEEEKTKAHTVWNWITHFKKTGEIHPDISTKIKLVEGIEGIKFESTRKRSGYIRREREKEKYEFCNVEGEWSNTDPFKKRRLEEEDLETEDLTKGSVGFANDDDDSNSDEAKIQQQ